MLNTFVMTGALVGFLLGGTHETSVIEMRLFAEKFDGKAVIFFGYLSTSMTLDGRVYETEEAMHLRDRARSIQIRLPESYKLDEKCRGATIRVTGVFQRSASDGGEVDVARLRRIVATNEDWNAFDCRM